jgi:hypothetical protein
MSRVAVTFTFLGLVAMGCATKKNPALMCPGGQCADSRFPYCDVDGAVGGTPNECLAVSCTPGQFIACDGDKSIVCNAAGSDYDSATCPTGCSTDTNGCKPCPANTATCGNGELDVCDANGVVHPQACAAGCVGSPMPHCAYLEPRYVPNACDAPASQDSLAFTNSGQFDPNLDNNCTGGVVSQTGGPSICVVRYREITIASGVTISIHNTNDVSGRTVAFVADDAITIDGSLDVSAHGALSGPGGGVLMSGGTPNTPSSIAGGGAGGATPGGPGGTLTADGGGANGGVAAADPALLAALIGGAAAWQVQDPSLVYGGGGGGGGITLVACRGDIRVAGTIAANGGGGAAGQSTLEVNGAGGGAGGYVVLQGLGVSVTGSVFSNGGGGGGGEQSTTAGGVPGDDGQMSDSVAARGGTPQNGEGGGGAGGVATVSPKPGKKPTTTGKPGGGGGSVGFLQTYTPQGIDPVLTPAHVSPQFQPNGTVPTR